MVNLTDGVAQKLDAVGGALGRYVRIYRTDNYSWVSMTGLKVFSDGVDIAQGIASSFGVDSGTPNTQYGNPLALTDGAYGGAHNGLQGASSNLAWVNGSKPYIELI